jgi:hypothetical protein
MMRTRLGHSRRTFFGERGIIRDPVLKNASVVSNAYTGGNQF